MISVASARKIILSMPESEELEHHGHPDFRVNNKIFATLWPAEARAVLKIRFNNDSDWVKCSPEALSVIAWGKQRWTNVNLLHANVEMFRQLVEEAWFAVAPKKLAANYVGYGSSA
jgi:hypothetical protein